jgi:hypothetical protein
MVARRSEGVALTLDPKEGGSATDKPPIMMENVRAPMPASRDVRLGPTAGTISWMPLVVFAVLIHRAFGISRWFR